LVVVLFLACNLITCCTALVAGGTLGAIRARRARRWTMPRRPLERDFAQPTPLPRQRDVGVAVLVLEVAEDSPAEDAGLRTGDLILAVDGQPLERDTDLREWISEYEPGDRISLTVRRGQRQADQEVKLGRRADRDDTPYLGITYHLMPLPHNTD
jgi:membrane-associated protease RseP (regulator of RpoE activity)